MSKLPAFAVTYPSGNTTAVIFDKMPPLKDKKRLNRALLAAWKTSYPRLPEIEQCCYVTEPKNPNAIGRVEMFGGEFCGNAARSVIWLLMNGRDTSGYIEVSGTDELLAFTIKNREVTLRMPLPKQNQLIERVSEGILVRLEGITQLVTADSKQTPRALLAFLLSANKYGLSSQPCVGVSYYNQSSNEAQFCVWVNAVSTIFDETACGSGTSAIGIATAANRERSAHLQVIQPSKQVIFTEATFSNKQIKASSITGKVDVLYKGKLVI